MGTKLVSTGIWQQDKQAAIGPTAVNGSQTIKDENNFALAA